MGITHGSEGGGGVVAAVGDGSRVGLDNSRQIIHRRLQRRVLRPESSFSLGARAQSAQSSGGCRRRM